MVKEKKTPQLTNASKPQSSAKNHKPFKPILTNPLTVIHNSDPGPHVHPFYFVFTLSGPRSL
jgi:hypothetical protein